MKMDKKIHRLFINQTSWRKEESTTNHLRDSYTSTTEMSRAFKLLPFRKKINISLQITAKRPVFHKHIYSTDCITKLHLKNNSKMTDK